MPQKVFEGLQPVQMIHKKIVYLIFADNRRVVLIQRQGPIPLRHVDIFHLVSEKFLAAPATRSLWVGDVNADRTELLVRVPVGVHQFMK